MNMDKENEDDERTEYAENPEDSHHGIHLASSSPDYLSIHIMQLCPSGRADSFSQPLQGKESSLGNRNRYCRHREKKADAL